MKRYLYNLLTTLTLCGLTAAYAEKTIKIELFDAKGKPREIGTITFKDTAYGLLITPNLKNLTPGNHGFHIHEKPSCADNGMAAGGHYDPSDTKKHLGPYDDFGHQGDMAILIVDEKGNATLPVLAPRLREFELENHAIMIHAGGDNYSDKPEKLGGGGARIACGVGK